MPSRALVVFGKMVRAVRTVQMRMALRPRAECSTLQGTLPPTVTPLAYKVTANCGAGMTRSRNKLTAPAIRKARSGRFADGADLTIDKKKTPETGHSGSL
jgi:hypothetical protein